MDWVRIHPFIERWPGGGPPPTFNIAADENGAVVVELAWDPQALLAPASYSNALRYYSTDVAFNAAITNDDGSNRNISAPAQNIQLVDNRVTWTMPQALWDGYLQESLKSLSTPARTTFSGNIYYRVRATAPGGQTRVWPSSDLLRGTNASAAPHIGVLTISATPSSQVIPDQAAVQAMGGIPFSPTFWGDLLLRLWRSLPESNADRTALAAIFAHEAFRNAGVATRADLLKLWLFCDAQSARSRIPRLLDRRAVVGSGVTQPIIMKTDLSGGRTLIRNLLDLLFITPHPSLAAVRTNGQLLEDVFREILDPNGQINQGAAGTCAPTSFQTLLITVNPAEYARLQKGLLSSAASSTLANGSAISVPQGVFAAASAAGISGPAFLLRTYSELAFQTAILKYAQGSRFPAFTGTPQNINNILQATITAGLTTSEMERGLTGIFNVRFTTNSVTFPRQPADAGWVSAQRQIRDTFLRDLPGRQQQMILAMWWGAPNPGGHAVMAVRRETASSRVFYKNPQYPGSTPLPGATQGGTAANPPRRYEDPTQSLESITESDLATWIMSYWAPETAII